MRPLARPHEAPSAQLPQPYRTLSIEGMRKCALLVRQMSRCHDMTYVLEFSVCVHRRHEGV